MADDLPSIKPIATKILPLTPKEEIGPALVAPEVNLREEQRWRVAKGLSNEVAAATPTAVMVDRDSEQGRAWQRYWAARRIPEPFCRKDGHYGKPLPSEWPPER